jgi:hypothetical protein
MFVGCSSRSLGRRRLADLGKVEPPAKGGLGIVLTLFRGWTVGGLALFAAHTMDDAAFPHIAEVIGTPLANLVYWVALGLAAWIIIPLCQAGVYRLTRLEPPDETSN